MALPRDTHGDHTPEDLLEVKGDHTIAVCLTARDAAATVGAIVESIRASLVETVALVDEIVVVDDHSIDATGRIAAAAGATVVDARTSTVGREGPGLGRAAWVALHETRGDLVAWCDADHDEFDVRTVTRLVAPLLTHPEIALVKGTVDPATTGDAGGRMTEIVARPLLAALFPELGTFTQPSGTEFSGRRRLLEQLRFVGDDGFHLALLIDAVGAVGLAGITEVGLGDRTYPHRSLARLGPEATDVMRAALVRAEVAIATPSGPDLPPLTDVGSYPYRRT